MPHLQYTCVSIYHFIVGDGNVSRDSSVTTLESDINSRTDKPKRSRKKKENEGNKNYECIAASHSGQEDSIIGGVDENGDAKVTVECAFMFVVLVVKNTYMY